MGDIVKLHTPFDLNTELGQSFVQDATRAGEGLITDRELSEKYELTNADWKAIRKDRALERAVRTERERRVRSGQAAREAATKHLVKGVGIVDQIMSAADTHPKHKLDAFRELRTTASVGDGADGRSGDRFVINIVLTGDEGTSVVEHYDKPLAIGPDDPKVSIKVDEEHGEK
jgi:hypothetical protein